MNKFIRPKMGKRGKLATCHSECGRYSRKIDYFPISSKNENWIAQIRNNKIANIRQAFQHKMLPINLQVKLCQHYHKWKLN